MDVLPLAGDRVRIPMGLSDFEGIVVGANGSARVPYVIVEVHLPDVEPYTATFLLRDVEPVPAS